MRAPEPIEAELGEVDDFDAEADAPAAAAPPPPPAEAPSLWDRFKRAIGGDADDEAPAEKRKQKVAREESVARPRPAAKADAKPEGEARARSRWIARALQRVGKRLVLELEIPIDGFEFTLFGATATVRRKDGSILAATFDLKATTKAGTYAKGHVVRIVLALADAEASEVDEVTVVLDDAEIHAR